MDDDSGFFENLRRVLDDLEYPERPQEPRRVPLPVATGPDVSRRTRWPLRTPVAAVLVLLVGVLLGYSRR
jgi:hypothetical protein